jgi:hypothetical protein
MSRQSTAPCITAVPIGEQVQAQGINPYQATQMQTTSANNHLGKSDARQEQHETKG